MFKNIAIIAVVTATAAGTAFISWKYRDEIGEGLDEARIRAGEVVEGERLRYRVWKAEMEQARLCREFNRDPNSK